MSLIQNVSNLTPPPGKSSTCLAIGSIWETSTIETPERPQYKDQLWVPILGGPKIPVIAK